ncbi:response regulator transcription factor [Paenibacillus herberti]|uniref:DNA-binding response regulator n=1 Tax=Paenibacillus herberti TaxID=1619309 RepID=A0A229P2Q3_9BACL|nr:response regulator transcription factor [Paenibacillus herberti]OXM16367.1 DNA-binding response regulator [Paenibacillus herberti]
MAKTILIVEDEQILREIIKDYLMNENYNVLEAADGNAALSLFEANEVHLIILDIMLPGMDGWSVCRRIRKSSNVPIIMLTARVDEDDTLLGFELGADDYVTKPYSPPVLLARTKRLLDSRYPIERSADTAGSSTDKQLLASGLRMHLPSRTLTVDEVEVYLTYTEFQILAYLMQNKGIVITREQLITKIWGYEYEGDDRTVNTHIRNIRNKLGDKSKVITTIVRTGYKFNGDL